MTKKFKNFKKYLFMVIFSIIFLFLFLNDQGILRYITVKSDINKYTSDINDADLKIERLKKEIDSLKTDSLKIEKVARERYHMHNKNEEGIKVTEK